MHNVLYDAIHVFLLLYVWDILFSLCVGGI